MTDAMRPLPSPAVPPAGPRLRVRQLDLGPVLTAADVGALLGVQSLRAARSLIVREGIPHVRIGKRLVVLRSSLVRWLRSREETGADRMASIRSAADRIGPRRRLSPVSAGRDV